MNPMAIDCKTWIYAFDIGKSLSCMEHAFVARFFVEAFETIELEIPTGDPMDDWLKEVSKHLGPKTKKMFELLAGIEQEEPRETGEKK